MFRSRCRTVDVRTRPRRLERSPAAEPTHQTGSQLTLCCSSFDARQATNAATFGVGRPLALLNVPAKKHTALLMAIVETKPSTT